MYLEVRILEAASEFLMCGFLLLIFFFVVPLSFLWFFLIAHFLKDIWIIAFFIRLKPSLLFKTFHLFSQFIFDFFLDSFLGFLFAPLPFLFAFLSFFDFPLLPIKILLLLFSFQLVSLIFILLLHLLLTFISFFCFSGLNLVLLQHGILRLTYCFLIFSSLLDFYLYDLLSKCFFLFFLLGYFQFHFCNFLLELLIFFFCFLNLLIRLL